MSIPRRARTTLVALGLGAAGWVLFLSVALAAAGDDPAVDPGVLYSAEWAFAGSVFARNLALCGVLWLVALVLTRRRAPGARILCTVAAVLLVAAWSARAGLGAGGIGLGADMTALGAATAPHTAAELGLIVLPLVAGARGEHIDLRWPLLAGAGLALCAALEAFL